MYKQTKYTGVSFYVSETRKHRGKPDKCFYIRYTKNGKRLREKIGWQSEGVSAQYASQVRAERILGKQKQQQITVNEAIEKYLKTAKEQKRTWKDDKYKLDYFKITYGNVSIDEITPEDIENFIYNVKKRGVKPATVKHYLQVLRRLYNYLSEINLFNQQNPAAKIKVSVPDNTIIEALTPEECDRLIEVCNHENIKYNGGYIILFALYTGLRASSIFRLKWEDIDIEKKLIRLKETKNKKQSTLILSDLAANLLKSIPHINEYVFPSPLGGQRKGIRRAWKKAKEKAKIRPHIRFHDLRHTFATMLAESGVDLEVISQMLTHSSITVTQKYAHVRNKRLKDAAEKIDKMFGD